MHGVMHLGWVPDGAGGYRGQMAVLVKPQRPARDGLHGGDRAVPAPDRLPAGDPGVRAGVACGLAFAGVRSRSSPTCTPMRRRVTRCSPRPRRPARTSCGRWATWSAAGPIPSTWFARRASAARGADGQPRLRSDGIGGAGAVRLVGARRRCGRSSWRATGSWASSTSTGCGRASPPLGAATCSAGTAARATRSTSSSGRRTRLTAWRRSAPSSGLVGHTHVAAAWMRTPRGARSARAGRRAARAHRWQVAPQPRTRPVPGTVAPRWWDALDEQAADGAFWLQLDIDRRVATWLRAPYDPAPARGRAGALNLDDAAGS